MAQKESIQSLPPALANKPFHLEYNLLPVQPHGNNLSIISYLHRYQPKQTLIEIEQWLNEQQLHLDTNPAKATDMLGSAKLLSIELTGHYEQEVNTQWQILWQNDDIIAAFKPAPLAVSRTTRNLYNTLISLVRRQSAHSQAQLLHRLDIETSGVILIAKNQQSDSTWKPKLKQLIEKKVYHAIVKGQPQWQQLMCENQLAERIDSDIRCKMYVVDPKEPIEHYRKPKDCKTLFSLIKSQGEYSLIECQLLTGRKHQIRAQLAGLDLPIVGDKIYSHDGHFFLKRLKLEHGLNDADYCALGARNHLLRAVSLTIRPVENEPAVTIDSASFEQDLALNLYQPAGLKDEKNTD
jgi:23S rRNA pseudouridine1911/1915/1917 synthase